jgi:alpha-glucosidase (family GH31 glycosyl hydrolase)
MERKFHAKKTATAVFISLVMLACISAADSLTPVSFVFSGSSSGWVSVKASVKNGSVPGSNFMLCPPSDAKNFVFNGQKGVWKEYAVTVSENAYTLFFRGKKIYTSEFKTARNRVQEYRTWYYADDFYGLGQMSRSLSLKNQTFILYNIAKYGDQTYVAVPFYTTDEGSAVYYNAASKDSIIFPGQKKDAICYQSGTGCIESFYKQCGSVKNAVSEFYAFSSSGSLLPRWAFGFIQSKYGYRNADEVKNLVTGFENRKIPLSAVVLDLYWFKHMGDLDWNRQEFPDPEGLDLWLEKKGIKLIAISEPFLTTASSHYDDFKKLGMLGTGNDGTPVTWHDWWCFDDSAGSVLNPLDDDAQRELGKIYTHMLDTGIDGFWTDLGEPESVPSSVLFDGVPESVFHNYYNYYWTKAIHSGVADNRPDYRQFILSRSAYTGSSAYNASTWSGDVSVSFESLAKQPALGMEAGMSGLPFWGSDVGGFTPERIQEELFVRWYQFGAFTPVFRAHGTGSREPWTGTAEDCSIISSVIRTRYRLLPYIYSIAHEASLGVPMMRPMIYESAKVPASYLDTQYMFGPAILVAPVTKPAADTPVKNVWLPSGSWYNFYTLEKTTGKRTVTVPVDRQTIPVFVKAGAVIPLDLNTDTGVPGNGKQTSAASDLALLLTPEKGVKVTFILYEDDGVTNKYLHGAYTETVFALNGMHLSVKYSGPARPVTLCVPSSAPVSTDGWTPAVIGEYTKVLKRVIMLSGSAEYDL